MIRWKFLIDEGFPGQARADHVASVFFEEAVVEPAAVAQTVSLLRKGHSRHKHQINVFDVLADRASGFGNEDAVVIDHHVIGISPNLGGNEFFCENITSWQIDGFPVFQRVIDDAGRADFRIEALRQHDGLRVLIAVPVDELIGNLFVFGNGINMALGG